MMRAVRAGAVLGATLCAAAVALAGPYDGVYVAHPEGGKPDHRQCAVVPILIAGERVQYHEVRCDLSNPVQIRALDGVLYDGLCWLDGGSSQTARKQGRVLIRRMASGDLALVTPFMDVRLATCQVAG